MLIYTTETTVLKNSHLFQTCKFPVWNDGVFPQYAVGKVCGWRLHRGLKCLIIVEKVTTRSNGRGGPTQKTRCKARLQG